MLWGPDAVGVPHLHARNVPFAVALACVAITAAFLLLPSGSGAGSAASANGTARAAAAAVPPAQAFAPGTPAFQTALATASAHWGVPVPCAGQIDYVWETMDPLTNARASWHNPTDPWADPAANFNCRIAFNATASFDFPAYCSVLAHELGHLLGHPHAVEEGQLMSAIYTTPLPECVAADPAAAAARAAAAASTAAPPVATPATNPTSSTRTTAAKPKAAKKPVAKKPTSKRKAQQRSKRCFTRMKAGKRVRTCTPTRKTRRLAGATKR